MRLGLENAGWLACGSQKGNFLPATLFLVRMGWVESQQNDLKEGSENINHTNIGLFKRLKCQELFVFNGKKKTKKNKQCMYT